MGRKLTLDLEEENGEHAPSFNELIAARRAKPTPPHQPPTARARGQGQAGCPLDHQLDDEDTLNPIHPNVGLPRTLRQLVVAAGRLAWWLGLPTKWGLAFARMLLFVLALLPALVPVFVHYCRSQFVKKNIPYGRSMRQMLDVYLPIPSSCGGVPGGAPPNGRPGCPVVVFVTGGAWVIGYKAWGFLWGMLLQRHGVLVVVPDYRNFPQVSVPGMVSDVSLAMGWVGAHVQQLGGDPANVTLVGQSAGAHLTLLMLLRSALHTAEGAAEGKQLISPMKSRDSLDSSPSTAEGGHSQCYLPKFRRWVGISGPYDMTKMEPILQARGLPARLVEAMFDYDVQAHSPMHVAGQILASMRDNQDEKAATHARRAVALLPELALYHGSRDKTVPCQQTKDLGEALRQAGATVTREHCYPHKSHTDPILEDTISGADELLPELMRMVHGDSLDGGSLAVDMPRLLPSVLLHFARMINPF